MSSTKVEKFRHPSGDTLLTILGRTSGPLGDLVRAFPGPDDSDATDWLGDWFRTRITEYFNESTDAAPPQPASEEAEADVMQSAEQVAASVRLLSVRPYYFRGFRDTPEPIVFSDPLVVIDGSNSSGKTSLAEALEWLFTGKLLRRSRGDLGNPGELENCITNAFRPDGEDTWVEAVFEVDGHRRTTLRRELISDYGPASTAHCISRLVCDGNELDVEQESDLLDQLFAGVPPILMQHSLRLFVHDNPAKRREYFERLLRLNGLTALISKAAIGSAGIASFRSPTGGDAHAKWSRLKDGIVEPVSRRAIRTAEKSSGQKRRPALEKALVAIAAAEFGDAVQLGTAIGPARAIIETTQRKARQQNFPHLQDLRPRRVLDDATLELLSPEALHTYIAAVEAERERVDRARAAAATITDAQIAIATAFTQLEVAGLIAPAGTDAQVCPLCAYEEVPTLTRVRTDLIRGWAPLRDAVDRATQAQNKAVRTLTTRLANIRAAVNQLIPKGPAKEALAIAIESAPTSIAKAARAVQRDADRARAALNGVFSALEDWFAHPDGTPSQDDIASLTNRSRQVIDALDTIKDMSSRYAQSFAALEQAVGTAAKGDAQYDRRQTWLDLTNDIDSLDKDLAWEQAKAKAHTSLEAAREMLKGMRQAVLESRRREFSDGIAAVWRILREDVYSGFSHLHIPKPTGKGYPVRIEVKALLDDGSERREVDALRVFSESQVHVLGIAAFVTRSKLLGHRLLILDDPVQSMDEEHFKSFAGPLLSHLLDEGFQVVVLTHNDLFAREVSVAQCERDEYVSMRIGHDQAAGCYVEEGTRRLYERLTQAKKRIQRDKMGDAWKFVRFAVERLCVLAYKKHGPQDFDPVKLLDRSAESMIEDAVGGLLEERVAGGKARLKEILRMTAGGAHDTRLQGKTDCHRAIRDLYNFARVLEIRDGKNPDS
ncbi:AAA family ATPase [Thioalkalivibrio sp.]|uniref:AAA family ATPase n=1 Tax=Thioalkalivibrio sp. TaxID=2093813 RepID=UPI0035625274